VLQNNTCNEKLLFFKSILSEPKRNQYKYNNTKKIYILRSFPCRSRAYPVNGFQLQNCDSSFPAIVLQYISHTFPNIFLDSMGIKKIMLEKAIGKVKSKKNIFIFCKLWKIYNTNIHFLLTRWPYTACWNQGNVISLVKVLISAFSFYMKNVSLYTVLCS
jgi:hypothetical protein